jgi:hypothetical protein
MIKAKKTAHSLLWRMTVMLYIGVVMAAERLRRSDDVRGGDDDDKFIAHRHASSFVAVATPDSGPESSRDVGDFIGTPDLGLESSPDDRDFIFLEEDSRFRFLQDETSFHFLPDTPSDPVARAPCHRIGNATAASKLGECFKLAIHPRTFNTSCYLVGGAAIAATIGALVYRKRVR